MKKLLMLMLCLTLLFCLTACGGDEEAPAPAPAEIPADQEAPAEGEEQPAAGEEQPDEAPAAAEDDFSKYVSGKYAEMMRGGRYYMESTAYVWGMDVKSKTAYDGDITDTISEVMGMKTRSLSTADMIYEIDDENKQYTATSLENTMAAMEDAGVAPMDYSDLKYVGSGNGPIPELESDTASYDYDEFVVSMEADGGDMDVMIRFYMKDDGQLYVMHVDVGGEGMIMNNVIEVFTDQIPAGMLELPAGYTQVDELTYGF